MEMITKRIAAILVLVGAVVAQLAAMDRDACGGQKNDSVEVNRIRVSEPIPIFRGGDIELMRFVEDNKRYPEDAYNQGIEGRVVTKFCITKTGAVDSVSVPRSKHPSLDAEAIRIVSSLPRFIPGKDPVTWEVVDRWGYLPITFNIKKYDERMSMRFPAFNENGRKEKICDGLYRVVDDGHIGFADETGVVVIMPRYRYAYPFKNGKAKVTYRGEKVKDGTGKTHWESDEWFYIDKMGGRLD